MHIKAILLLLVLGILFAGCASLPTTAPPSDPIVEGDSGGYIHSYSGVEFPPNLNSYVGENVTSYERGNLAKYDAEGYDISFGYNSFDKVYIAATLYVYPTAYRDTPDLGQEYNGVKRAIERAFKAAILMDELDSVLEVDGEQITAKMCLYAVGPSSERITNFSSAVLYSYKDWFILRRITAGIPLTEKGELNEQEGRLLWGEMMTPWEVFPTKECPIAK